MARRCGFGSTETLRQAYLGRYGVTPSQARATARASADRRAGGSVRGVAGGSVSGSAKASAEIRRNPDIARAG
ncbi:hypothetical protein [Streptomyces sp. NPDC000410]|uniref:hypothetical protein n=1 Tax=Streptomyces sp. NPDC000410 TaxID=3154254 RepID=UPI00331DB680